MNWNYPLFDLDYDEREAAAAAEVIASKWISMGDKTKKFEGLFSEMLYGAECVAVTNCTAGLHLSLLALGIGPGDEVIVPSLSFVATVNAVLYVGATPVFADIGSLEDLTISPESIESLITDATKAIVVMHYAGFPCDMESICAIADSHDLRIVEDCAHAPGVISKGKPLGTFGDVSAFSFYSNKNLSTAEGGMVVTTDEHIAGKVRLLRSHGMTTLSYDRFKGHAVSYDVTALGYNYRIDDIRAALGIVQLDKLRGDVEKRKVLVKRYREWFENVQEIIVPFTNELEGSSHYILPVVVGDQKSPARRDSIRQRLKDAGIQTSVHYPAIHEFSIYAEYTRPLDLTEIASRNELTLPLYNSLTLDDVDTIAKHVVSCVSEEYGS